MEPGPHSRPLSLHPLGELTDITPEDVATYAQREHDMGLPALDVDTRRYPGGMDGIHHDDLAYTIHLKVSTFIPAYANSQTHPPIF